MPFSTAAKHHIKRALHAAGYEVSKIQPQFNNLKNRADLAPKNSARQCQAVPQKTKVHLFWAYGNLSKLELLSLLSFIKHGYDVQLWTYGTTHNAPHGTALRDAREVFEESRVFTYKNGSYAAFSNLFRYAVLMKEGGMWADTDVICLMPSAEIENSGVDEFYVTERTRDNKIVCLNTNIIYLRNPYPGCLTDLAIGIAERYQTDKLIWGSCGPRLLTTLARNYPEITPWLMEPNFANPIDWKDCPKGLLKPANEIPKHWGFLHCYNEMWRQAGINKNDPYPVGSLMKFVENSFA